MKTEPCHDNCLSCEYRAVCSPLLKFLHRIMKVCKQGRKAAVRIKCKDQVTLDEIHKGES